MNTRAGGGSEEGQPADPDDTLGTLFKEGSEEERSILAQTIETEIVPRLMLVLNESAELQEEELPASFQPTDKELDALLAALLVDDLSESISVAERVRNRGISLNDLCTRLLAPAARVLGKYWEEDRCTFTDVTVALCTLQHVLHHFSSGLPSKCVEPLGPEYRAILVPLPEEQHSFGLLMVVEFFRRFGWQVLSGPVDTDRELCRLLRSTSFRLLGLSITSDDHLDGLRKRINAYREQSLNPDMIVLVGGRIFDTDPDLVAQVGADGTAGDGLHAVRTARLLMAEA